MNFSNDQQKAIDACLNSSYKKLFITGKGGTGKSEIIKHVTSQLAPSSFILLAPTQSAALNIDGQTIHSFFKVKPVINLEVEKEEDVLSFDLNEIDSSLADNKIVIIDEVSMLGEAMFKGILERITPSKLILFGDPEQLKPIKDKAVNWSKFCDKTITLSHNYRINDKTVKLITETFRSEKRLHEATEIVASVKELSYDKDTIYIANTNYNLSKLQQYLLGYSHAKVNDIVLTFGACDETISRQYKNKHIAYFTNNDLVRIKHLSKFEKDLWKCEVERVDNEPISLNQYNKTPYVIVGDYNKYKKLLKARFSKAQAYQRKLKKFYKTSVTAIMKKKSTEGERNELRLLWIAYFELKNAPYARHQQFRTTYKSQGKSFDKVVIDWDDLPSVDHKEVALGRAKNSIKIILDEL